MPTQFSKGDEVQRVSDPSQVGVVLEVVEMHGGVQWYTVKFDGLGKRKMAEVDLRPYIEAAAPTENLSSANLGGYREFQRAITYHRLVRNQPLRNNIYAFNASRTKFYPYQFKPLLKLLDSPKNRLLIGDEVGLGKTIEAGLILTELRARESLPKILVVCPSNLTDKWKTEMKRRFGENFSVLKASDFRELLKEYGEHPESARFQVIASLETLRNKQLLNELEDLSPDFDLVIVDEAHHMRNPRTSQHALGKILGNSSHSLLLLTATPVHLGNQDLFSLLHILDDENFPDLATSLDIFKENEPLVLALNFLRKVPCDFQSALNNLKKASQYSWVKSNPMFKEATESLENLQKEDPKTPQYVRQLLKTQREVSELNLLTYIFARTRRRDVHELATKRRAYNYRVIPTEREMRFYSDIIEMVRRNVEASTESALIVQWALHMPQRRTASCIAATVQFYKKNPVFDLSDTPEDLTPLPEIDNGELHLQLPQFSKQEFKKLVDSWNDNEPDSKYRKFLEILKENQKIAPQSKGVLFAFFKDSLHYLQKKLSADGIQVYLTTGDTPAEDRLKIIESFRNDPGFCLLLSSRVGTEGLDFQFCDSLYNYDLPWNPMEVEQRIGRLDRIGQTSSVINIFNFWMEGTIEQRILDRLFTRIKIFEHSIGDLEPIIGDELIKLEVDLLSRHLTPQEEQERIEQTARAIEQKRVDSEELEAEAVRFIGTDEYIDEEINDIQKKRRYVTPEQLHRFLQDFIRNHCPRTRIAFNEKTNLGIIAPDEELAEFIQRHVPNPPAEYLVPTSKIDITFDSQTAFENPNVDFLSSLHPVTEAIVRWYGREKAELTNAHHVVLRTNSLSPGTYYFFVYRLNLEAARGQTTLESIIVGESGELSAGPDLAEQLLGEMVEAGQEPTRIADDFDPQIIKLASQKARRYLMDYIGELRNSTQKNNDLFIDQRLSVLKNYYSRLRETLEQRIKKAEAEKRTPGWIKGQRTRAANLAREEGIKALELKSKRQISVNYDEVAAGILEPKIPGF